jgi:hypothetical protein
VYRFTTTLGSFCAKPCLCQPMPLLLLLLLLVVVAG